MTRYFTILSLAAVAAIIGCNADPVRPDNKAPVVNAISVGLDDVYLGDMVPIEVDASDPDGDPVTFRWVVGSGYATGSGRGIIYTPTVCCLGGNPVIVTVRDSRGAETRAELFIKVTP
jgi:hypothetical protein